jgi:hypothetical protein
MDLELIEKDLSLGEVWASWSNQLPREGLEEHNDWDIQPPKQQPTFTRKYRLSETGFGRYLPLARSM